MASRPTRRDTGVKVAGLVDRLSDGLLGDEQLCRQAMEDVFVAALPRGRRWLDTHKLPAVVGVAGLDGLALIVLEVAARCLAPAQALWEVAAAKALESLHAELVVVERNLGRRYDGLADQAVEQAGTGVAALVTAAVDSWSLDIASAMVWWDDRVDEEFRAAVVGEEDAETVRRRLFSAEPVYVAGHSGAGLWWKPFQTAFAAARSQEFIVVNMCREHGMLAFNSVGTAVRDG